MAALPSYFPHSLEGNQTELHTTLFAGVLARSTALPSYFSHSLEGNRSRLMSTRAQTELHTKEMKKRKKRETDRRYRQNMKVNASLSSTAAAHHETAVQETQNQLAMTIIENENLKRAVQELRQVILHLTSQRELIEQRTAVQDTKNQLAMTIMENENLKRAVQELRQVILHLTSQRQFIEQRFNTIYTELEKEIECVRAAAEGFGEQRGMTLGTGNYQQPFHVVSPFSN